MNSELRNIADNIIDAAIKAVLPDAAVKIFKLAYALIP